MVIFKELVLCNKRATFTASGPKMKPNSVNSLFKWRCFLFLYNICIRQRLSDRTFQTVKTKITDNFQKCLLISRRYQILFYPGF